MRDILNCMTIFSQLPQMQQSASISSTNTRGSSETQTDIVAVHTPQIDHQKDFPFTQKIQRPQSLGIIALEIHSSSTNDSSVSNTATDNDGEFYEITASASVSKGDELSHQQ